jgi:hypothetical protein
VYQECESKSIRFDSSAAFPVAEEQKQGKFIQGNAKSQGDYRAGTIWTPEPENGNNGMEQKDNKITHFNILSRMKKASIHLAGWLNQQFAMDTTIPAA